MAVQRVRHLDTKAGVISYTLTRSARRRTIEISVSEQARVRIAAPRYALLRDIHDFIHQKSDWIVNKLREMNQYRESLPRRQYRDGCLFYFLGQSYPLRVCSGNVRRAKIHFDGTQWRVQLPLQITEKEQTVLVKQQLLKWYRQQAEEILGSRLFHYSRLTGLEPQKIAIRTHRRVWGNCHYQRKVIHLNWQLVFFPQPVIDYVIVHELSHLDVPNHSKKFWHKVGTVLPDYKYYRQWLKNHSRQMALP